MEEEEDHEDIELIVKELAALRKVCEYISLYCMIICFV